MFHKEMHKQVKLLGINAGTLAALVGISAPTLSNFFKGRRELFDGKDRRLIACLRDLKKLQECFPVQIGLTDAKHLQLALERFHNGKFDQFRAVTEKLAKELQDE